MNIYKTTVGLEFKNKQDFFLNLPIIQVANQCSCFHLEHRIRLYVTLEWDDLTKTAACCSIVNELFVS